MSELLEHGVELNRASEEGAAGVSPGALMRQAREASGIHVDVLAAALKITVDRLEALEADNYAALPDMVFARALASSACRILKIEPMPILALMPKNKAQSLPTGRSDINASFRDSAKSQGRNQFAKQLTRPLGLAVLLLLVGAGVLFFLPERGDTPEKMVAAPVQSLAMNEAIDISPPPQPVPMVQDLEIRTSVAPIALLESNAVDAKNLDVADGRSAVVGSSSAPVGEVLEFRASEATWIQVRDATKAVVFERILTKGASASATGILPLSVVIGRADSTEVFVRGTPFILNSVAKENVARFEVK